MTTLWILNWQTDNFKPIIRIFLRVLALNILLIYNEGSALFRDAIIGRGYKKDHASAC